MFSTKNALTNLAATTSEVFSMSHNYVMDKKQWVQEVISLLPDCYTDKAEIADDLSYEFGILSGLVSGGWYPNEALDVFLGREFDNDKISDADMDEYNLNLEAYCNDKQA